MFKLLYTSDDLKIYHPFSYLVSGPSVSVNSELYIRFLQNLDALCSDRNFDVGVIWCHSKKTAVSNQHLAVLMKQIRYNEAVPSDFENAHGKPCLVILDDLLNNVYSKEVCELFTKGSHHRNINEVLFTQNNFHQGRYFRDISLNDNFWFY